MRPLRLRARAAFLPGGEVRDDAALVMEGGLIRRVGRPRGGEKDLGELLLCPGLVNAHVHLELSGLTAPARPRSFILWAAWVGLRRSLRKISERRSLVDAAARAARRLLREGTTCIGELSTVGASAEALSGLGLCGVLYREIVEPRPRRAPVAARKAAERAREEASRCGLLPGLFPHATYSVSGVLLRAVRELAGGMRLAIHAAETPEEVRLFERGGGALRWLRRLVGAPGRVSGRGTRPVEWLGSVGFLDRQVTLVHCTHLSDGEVDLVKRAGASVVVCPRSARYFGPGPLSLGRLLEAGVPVGLGTDSPMSSGTPSIIREMRELRRLLPGLRPEKILLMATELGAGALGLSGRCGVLAPGARADLAAFPYKGRGTVEALVSGELLPDLVVLGGRVLHDPGALVS